MRLSRLMLAAGFIGTVAVAPLAYVVAQVQRRAEGDVEDYLLGPPAIRPPVVCLGASIVRGRASVDFVQILRERVPERTFVNAGVNSNTVWEVLQRVDDVLACEPSEVMILVGTNDVQATLAPDGGAKIRDGKHLPAVPSVHDYLTNLDAIVARLQVAGCRVAVASLPPLGQDLESPANVRLREFNEAIGEVALRRGATYLPVYEALAHELITAGAAHGPGWTGSWRPGMESLGRHFLLGQSYDEIAEMRGRLLSPDDVHLDTHGATIVADAVERFVRAAQPSTA